MDENFDRILKVVNTGLIVFMIGVMFGASVASRDMLDEPPCAKRARVARMKGTENE